MNSATDSSTSYDKDSEGSNDDSASVSTETSTMTEDEKYAEYIKKRDEELKKIDGVVDEYLKQHPH